MKFELRPSTTITEIEKEVLCDFADALNSACYSTDCDHCALSKFCNDTKTNSAEYVETLLRQLKIKED